MFDFLIFDIFLTHQLNLNHLSPLRAIFLFFSYVQAMAIRVIGRFQPKDKSTIYGMKGQ